MASKGTNHAAARRFREAMKRVLVLDTYNLLLRSLSSLPSSIVAGDGRPIHAVYGAVAAIIRLVRDLEPSNVVAAFDTPEVATFRQQMYAGYQAQRGPLGGEQAEEFARQAAIALGALPAIGVAALASPGFEADDIMGSVGLRVVEAGGEAVLVSTDRDLLQLVRPGLSVLPPGSGAVPLRSAEDVRERIGVAPQWVPTFKSLAGDASDNIPGIRGIGPKTAVSLVETYGALEQLYARLDELPSRLSSALMAGKVDAFLFRELATIRTDLDVPDVEGELPAPEITPDSKVRDLLRRMGYGPPEPATQGEAPAEP